MAWVPDEVLYDTNTPFLAVLDVWRSMPMKMEGGKDEFALQIGGRLASQGLMRTDGGGHVILHVPPHVEKESMEKFVRTLIARRSDVVSTRLII